MQLLAVVLGGGGGGNSGVAFAMMVGGVANGVFVGVDVGVGRW